MSDVQKGENKMRYCIAVFASRTQVYEFVDVLLSGGINARVVNTPAEAHIGCGVSAEFPYINFPHASGIVRRFSSFRGFYLLDRTPRGVRVTVL